MTPGAAYQPRRNPLSVGELAPTMPSGRPATRPARRLNMPRASYRITCLATLALFGLVCAPARADTTFNVTPTSSCSLTDAVNYASGTPESNCTGSSTQTPSGTTTIDLAAGTYSTWVQVSGTLTTDIAGQGPSSTIIDDAGLGRSVLINNAGATTTVSGVELTGGSGNDSPFVSGPEGGGGVWNAGTLTLENDVIAANNGGVIAIDSPQPPPASGAPGGGILNDGTLILTNSEVTGNATSNGQNGYFNGIGTPQPGGSGGDGGGLFNAPDATGTIVDSTISGNQTGMGGAGLGGGVASITTASPGGAGGAGGGIENEGTLTVSDSAITGNTTGMGGAGGNASLGASNQAGGAGAAGGNGGGIDSSGTLSVTNSTFAHNATQIGGVGGTSIGLGAPGAGGSPGLGGGISTSAGLASLDQVTVAFNSSAASGGGLYATTGGVITEANSIVSDNTGVSDLNCASASSGVIANAGSDIVFGDNAASLCPGVDKDPLLDSTLAFNGGPTETLAIRTQSPAIDLVASSSCSGADQRGIPRPQPEGCSAGAYQYAPPLITSTAASASSTTSATVTASITPNLSAQPTMVTVNYGTGTSFGSSTAAQNIGDGSSDNNAAVAFSAGLTGLAAGTTYHYDIVATNGDGPTTSGDGTFTTPAASVTSTGTTTTAGTTTTISGSSTAQASAAILGAAAAGDELSLTVACRGGVSTAVCGGPVLVTSKVTTQDRKPVEVAALAQGGKGKKGKPKPSGKTTAVVTVATGSYSVATGQRATLRLTLTTAGQKLLDRFYRVPALVTLEDAPAETEQVTFRYARISSPIAYTWLFTPHYSLAQALTLSGLPSKPTVDVICRGGGCPFAKRAISPHTSRLALAPILAGSHLQPGATLEIEITAHDEVGKVAIFTIRSGEEPTLAESCLVPGARAPAACA